MAKTGLGNLARYIIRACFSQERMVYVPAEDSADGVAKGVYTSKDRKVSTHWTGWPGLRLIFPADMNKR